jgi:hypothetical protein
MMTAIPKMCLAFKARDFYLVLRVHCGGPIQYVRVMKFVFSFRAFLYPSAQDS